MTKVNAKTETPVKTAAPKVVAKTTVVAEAKTLAPVAKVAEVVVAAPVKVAEVKKTKATKTVAAAEAVAPAVTVMAATETATAVEGAVATDATEASPVEEAVSATITDLIAKVDALYKSSKAISTELRKLQKTVAKELKDAHKKSKKVRGKKGLAAADKPKRAPSGFAKPSVISAELCEFLGKPSGTEIARTDVTKFLTQYIKKNELQQPENKRVIVPDEKLKKLLKVTPTDIVTYFNLQKFMKAHFPKPVPAVVVVAAPASV